MEEDFFSSYSMLEPPKYFKESQNSGDKLFVNNPSFDFNMDNKYGGSGYLNRIFAKFDENNNKRDEYEELKGSEKFEEAFEKARQKDPSIDKYKNFLVKTAKRESGFHSYIQNQAGAPYYGYFQMGKEEIKRTTGLSVEEFRRDPVAQILGAVKLYQMNLKALKVLKTPDGQSIYQLGKNQGYSEEALISGAWMGGPGGVKKYLLGLGDPSDSHWYKNGQGGSSVGKIINSWK